MNIPDFIIELRDRENQNRALLAIMTRYLLIVGIWVFVIVTNLVWGMTFQLIPITIVAGLMLVVNTVSYYLTKKWKFPLIIAVI